MEDAHAFPAARHTAAARHEPHVVCTGKFPHAACPDGKGGRKVEQFESLDISDLGCLSLDGARARACPPFWANSVIQRNTGYREALLPNLKRLSSSCDDYRRIDVFQFATWCPSVISKRSKGQRAELAVTAQGRGCAAE